MGKYRGKIQKNDEYYTTYKSIERFIDNRCDKNIFSNKTIYCNCDDYRVSSFTKYFKDHFDEYNIDKLICTNYDNGDGSYIYIYDGKNETIETGIDDGSYENYSYLINNETIIATNPPFSLYKQYIKFLYDNDAKFFLVGTQAAICCHIRDHINDIYFSREYVGLNSPYEWWEGKETTINGIGFLTNIDGLFLRTRSLISLEKTYSEIEQVHTDEGYLMINKCKNIPIDYDEPILVPISFLALQPEYRKMFRIDVETRFKLPPHTYSRLLIKKIMKY